MKSSFTADSIAKLSLCLGDDALILGQRLCEWCGCAPSTEIDLALSNMGLDLLGQARHFLTYAGELEGAGRDEDALAYGRDVLDFHNCLLVEQPNSDFAQTMLRHFFFTTWQLQIFDRLALCKDETLAGIARKSRKEIQYHVRVSAEWVKRLGDGTEESHQYMVNAVDWLWRFVDELFELNHNFSKTLDSLGVNLDDLHSEWIEKVKTVFAEANLAIPDPVRGTKGGRDGHHSEHLGPLLAEMQVLQRTYPGARW